MSEQFLAALSEINDPTTRQVWISKDIMTSVYGVCNTNAEQAQSCARLFDAWLMRFYRDAFPSVLFSDRELQLNTDNIRFSTMYIAGSFDAANQRWMTTSPAGNDVVCHFAQTEMCNTIVSGNRSANDLWRGDGDERIAFLTSMFKCRKAENLAASSLRNAAKFRHILPSGFTPLVMKTVIDNLFAMCTPTSSACASTASTATAQQENRGISVLDPCAGWGHRLVGFWGSRKGRCYVGVDPNKNMHPIYESISAYLLAQKEQWCEKSFRFLNIQAEADDFCSTVQGVNDGNQFDLVLTCPPYYDVEKYANNDSAQAHVQYKSYEVWRERFLAAMMVNCTACLRPGGLFGLVVRNCSACPTLCHDTRYIAMVRCKLRHKYTVRLCLTHKENSATHEFLFIFFKPQN